MGKRSMTAITTMIATAATITTTIIAIAKETADMSIITIEEIRRNKEIDALVKQANHVLEVIGYTEHGPRHVGYVSHMASEILRALEYPDRTVELAAIAGWVHDVGNSVNRLNHGIIGGTLLYPILRDIGMPLDEVATIISAVGNHEEQNGMVVSEEINSNPLPVEEIEW